MLIGERHDRILHKLEKDGMVYVSGLSQAFQVSEETIRRDLEKLEEEGYAKRCYGGASFTGGMDLPIKVRKKTNVIGKRRIAERIAQIIPDGACVALDDSSTATFVAEALKPKKELTVITYSIEIALLLSGKEDWNILLTGGKLRSKHLSMLGPRAVDFIRNYTIGWTVISCAGTDRRRGIFDTVEENAEVKQAMIAAAEHTILAIDRQKFERRSFALICPFKDLDTIVTDAELERMWKKEIEENQVELICALQ